MQYVEIAQGTPRNRGHLVLLNELANYVNNVEPLYRSIYVYPEEALDAFQNTASVRNYKGSRSIDKVIIDIDKGDNSDNHTINFARGVAFELEEYGLSRKAMQPYFSGTGYHIAIPNSAFNFDSGVNLPMVVKATIKKLLPDVDTSIYMRSGVYRVAHTLNQKVKLFKIPLSMDELYSLDPKEIKDMAANPRIEFPYAELFAEGELEEHVVANPNPIVNFNKVTEPTKIVPCIQAMLREGAVQGSRHNSLLRIISHFKRNGIPSEYSKVMIKHWNNDSLDDNELMEQVDSCYNGNYRYSCNDTMLKDRCQTRCMYFQHKDYSIEIKNATDLQDELHERLTEDFSGRTLNLSKAFGLTGIDAEIYPGELVTIFGPTGSNKTTVAQNLVLGVDFKNDRIVNEWQVPTLFLSLELSAWYMHRRHLQIVSNLDKDEVNEDYKGVFEKHHDSLNHIVVQTVAPTLNQIKEKIRELQPAVIVVDYIDLIETPRGVNGEYDKIKHISHGLSSMAVNMDVIIIQISQVAREYSRNEVLDLYAGKGSGAIENASRKVIGLNGQANSTKKTFQVYKNTDGELFSVDLEWRPSFRMSMV
jgi:archaellum biogenesis ATPase FlaH